SRLAHFFDLNLWRVFQGRNFQRQPASRETSHLESLPPKTMHHDGARFLPHASTGQPFSRMVCLISSYSPTGTALPIRLRPQGNTKNLCMRGMGIMASFWT